MAPGIETVEKASHLAFPARPFFGGAQRGTTLIEVIVSLAILSMCATFLAQLMLRGMNESRQARERARAVLLAQELMEEILAHRFDLPAWEKGLADRFDLDPETNMYRCRGTERGGLFWDWDLRRPDRHEDMKEAIVRIRWQVPGRRTLAMRGELRSLFAGGPPLPAPPDEEAAP